MKRTRRQKIKDLLLECTEEQQVFFHRLFPNGVDNRDLNKVLALVERTIESNKQTMIKELGK